MPTSRPPGGSTRQYPVCTAETINQHHQEVQAQYSEVIRFCLQGEVLSEIGPKNLRHRMDYKKIADDVSQKILSYSQDTSGWKVVKSAKNITVSWKPSKEYSGSIYRGEGIIEEIPEKVIPFMYLEKYRAKWDSALKSYSIVGEIDENTVICHCITHSYGMGIISSREFVDLIHIRRYDGGVVTTNTVSVEYDKCPVTSSHVRGFNNPCGYVCSPLPENPAHSKLVVFIQPDLGGLLPRAVVETALPSNVVNLISEARDTIKKHLQG